MFKQLLVLGFLCITQIISGQKTFVQFDKNISDKIYFQAEKLINDKISHYKKYQLLPFTAIKTHTSNSFVYKLTSNGIEIDGSKIIIKIDDTGKLIYYKEFIPKLEKEYLVNHSIDGIWRKILKVYDLQNATLIESKTTIKTSLANENSGVYHYFNVADYTSMRYLEILVNDENQDVVEIKNYGTTIPYEHFERTVKVENKIQNESLLLTCCNGSFSDNAKIHLMDPTSNSSCSDIYVDYISSGGCNKIATNLGITFINNASPGVNDDGYFCYNYDDSSSLGLSCTNERNDVSYDKLHSYYYLKSLIGNYGGPADVIINVDVVDDLIVQGIPSNNEIRLGRSDNWNHFGADQFHITHAYFQLALNNLNPNFLNNSHIHLGSADYFSHNKLSTIGECGKHGGLIGSNPAGNYVHRSNNFDTYNAAVPTIALPGHFIQAWGSLLTKIDMGLNGTIGIGSTETKSLLIDAVDQMSDFYDIFQCTQDLYTTAENAPYISLDELCRIATIIKDFMPSNFTLEGASDYMVKDLNSDTGLEPMTSYSYQSPHIWNRYSDDGGTTHLNPKYDNGVLNYLHVRVTGRGCIPTEEKYISAYYTMASTGLSWPTDWVNNLPFGDQAGSAQNIGELERGESQVFVFPWIPPNPTTLPGSGSGNKHHVCTYARITDANDVVYSAPDTDPPFTEIISSNSNIAENTRNFNSIAWKNMDIIYVQGIVGEVSETHFVHVQNTFPPNTLIPPDVLPNKDIFMLEFEVAPVPRIPGIHEEESEDLNFFEKGTVLIELDEDLVKLVDLKETKGLKMVRPNLVEVLDETFTLGNLELEREKKYRIGVSYTPKEGFSDCSFSIRQLDKKGKFVGGETFQIFKDKRKENINSELSIRNEYTKKISTSIILSPNPSNGKFQLYLGEYLDIVKSIIITDNAGREIQTKYNFDKKDTIDFDLSKNSVGLYYVRIVLTNGNIIVKEFIKN